MSQQRTNYSEMKSNWIVCSAEGKGKPHPFLFTCCALFIFIPQNGENPHTHVLQWTFTQQLNGWLTGAPECVHGVLIKRFKRTKTCTITKPSTIVTWSRSHVFWLRVSVRDWRWESLALYRYRSLIMFITSLASVVNLLSYSAVCGFASIHHPGSDFTYTHV